MGSNKEISIEKAENHLNKVDMNIFFLKNETKYVGPKKEGGPALDFKSNLLSENQFLYEDLKKNSDEEIEVFEFKRKLKRI